MPQEQSATIDVATMKNLLNPAKVFAVDEDFLLAEVRLDGSCDISPFRFSGITLYFCIEGTFRLIFNDREATVGPSQVTASPPTSLVRFEKADEEGPDPVFVVLAMSQKFIFDLKLDIGEMFDHIRRRDFKNFLADMVVSLNGDVFGLVMDHCNLIGGINRLGLRQKKYHFTILLSSMLNVIASGGEGGEMKVMESQTSRSKAVFADFMKLAVENFETERSIQFYADKLCLTPKYLSKLIKDGCGSSASALIDNLVIAKAKNLLRHTDYSVKIVAAKLNFSTQSSFNKFFKAKTGTSPLKFRTM